MRTLGVVLVMLCLGSRPAAAQAAAPDAQPGIARFNKALDDATRRMDNAATLALWEDDGVTLLPQTAPVAGKKAIAAFLDAATAPLAGARMETFDMDCHDIEVSGDSASEWCNEHQVVRLSSANTFNGWGRMLLLLHRGADGTWRMKREMWQPAMAQR
jgi:ketosteroid isomerase-like protein